MGREGLWGYWRGGGTVGKWKGDWYGGMVIKVIL